MTGSIQMIKIICLPAQVARIVSFFSGLPRVAWLCPFFSCSVQSAILRCRRSCVAREHQQELALPPLPPANQHLLEIPKFPVASAGARAPASTLNTTGVSRRLRTRQWNHQLPLTLSLHQQIRRPPSAGSSAAPSGPPFASAEARHPYPRPAHEVLPLES